MTECYPLHYGIEKRQYIVTTMTDAAVLLFGESFDNAHNPSNVEINPEGLFMHMFSEDNHHTTTSTRPLVTQEGNNTTP